MSDFIERPARPDIQPVDLTEHFATAVNDYRECTLWFRALSIHKNMEGAVLYGGALRDIFLGQKPADYDVDAGGYCEVSAASYDPEKGRFISTEGYHTLDLKYVENPKSLEEKALEGDAPINSIAMDVKGRVLAHPKFAEHASKGIYEVRKDLSESETKRAVRRFDRLRERYPDWELHSEDPVRTISIRLKSNYYLPKYQEELSKRIVPVDDNLSQAQKRAERISRKRGALGDLKL